MHILATADLHIRKKAETSVLARILQAAKDRAADALLIGGDLLDRSVIDAEAATLIRSLLGAASLPIFLVAGNHDPLAVTDLYKELPQNVTVFPEEMTCYILSEGVRLFGYSAPRERGVDRPLQGFTAPADGVNILLAHGQPDGNREAFRPIAAAELAMSGLDLAVVGHIHKGEQRLCGRCRLLVPGIPQGKGFDELDEKFIYLIDTTTWAIEPISVAERFYREYTVDLSGCADENEILSRMEAVAIPEDTVGRLILEGAPSADPATAARIYTDRTGREVKDRTDPSLAVELLRKQNTLQGAFVRKAMAQIEEASPEERPLLEEALKLGLQALKEARR